jgi:hypothetical protein
MLKFARCTTTKNVQSSEATLLDKLGIIQVDFDPTHRELEEDLASSSCRNTKGITGQAPSSSVSRVVASV